MLVNLSDWHKYYDCETCILLMYVLKEDNIGNWFYTQNVLVNNNYSLKSVDVLWDSSRGAILIDNNRNLYNCLKVSFYKLIFNFFYLVQILERSKFLSENNEIYNVKRLDMTALSSIYFRSSRLWFTFD